MELYILDGLLRRDVLIDQFESSIWTERYGDIGDFQLVVESNNENRKRFLTGITLACNRSKRVMIVENVEKKDDEDGKKVLTVKGRSMEKILEDRVAKQSMSNLTTNPKWVISGAPGDVARTMFNDICRTGKLNLSDKIPFLMPGTIYPEDTIEEVSANVVWEQEPDSLYNAMKKICDMYDLGFRLVRNGDTSQLYFDIYSGSDRTSQQTLLDPVIFAPNLDNMTNTTEITTTEDTKNCAYVFSSQGFEVVYAIGTDPDVTGFDRRVISVNADDLETPEGGVAPTPAQISSHLIRAGNEALNEHRSWTGFDGELNENTSFEYEKDYFLGDLVDMRNEDGAVNRMRVTEQIFVSDKEGDRSYPTLAVNLFITPGSWLTLGNKKWVDFGLTEYWTTL